MDERSFISLQSVYHSVGYYSLVSISLWVNNSVRFSLLLLLRSGGGGLYGRINASFLIT